MELNCCCVRVLRMLKEYEFSNVFLHSSPLSLRSYIRQRCVRIRIQIMTKMNLFGDLCGRVYIIVGSFRLESVHK